MFCVQAAQGAVQLEDDENGEEGEEEAAREHDACVDPDKETLVSESRVAKSAPKVALGSLLVAADAKAKAKAKSRAAAKRKNSELAGDEDEEQPEVIDLDGQGGQNTDIPQEVRDVKRLSMIIDSLNFYAPCFSGLVPQKVFEMSEKPGRQLRGARSGFARCL